MTLSRRFVSHKTSEAGSLTRARWRLCALSCASGGHKRPIQAWWSRIRGVYLRAILGDLQRRCRSLWSTPPRRMERIRGQRGVSRTGCVKLDHVCWIVWPAFCVGVSWWGTDDRWSVEIRRGLVGDFCSFWADAFWENRGLWRAKCSSRMVCPFCGDYCKVWWENLVYILHQKAGLV